MKVQFFAKNSTFLNAEGEAAEKPVKADLVAARVIETPSEDGEEIVSTIVVDLTVPANDKLGLPEIDMRDVPLLDDFPKADEDTGWDDFTFGAKKTKPVEDWINKFLENGASEETEEENKDEDA